MSMEEVIDIVSKKLDGTDFEDYEIEEAVKEAEFQIRNFTGRWQRKNIVDLYGTVTATEVEELPRELNYVWASIALDTLRLGPSAAARAQGAAGIDTGRVVKSIKEGDVSIDFDTAAGSSTGAGIVTGAQIVGNYAEQLYPFRRLYASVGETYAHR
jgi:hypothetical protein